MLTRLEKQAQNRKRAMARRRKRRERLKAKREELGLKGKNGKPRRAEGLAKQRCIYLDADTYKHIRQEFGTVGAAVFYLSQSLKEFREKHGLIPPEPDTRDKTRRPPLDLSKGEASFLCNLIEDYIADWCETRRDAEVYKPLLQKLEKLT